MQQREMITREAALRVALAARALPNITLPKLIEVLQKKLGEQLDAEILRTFTVTDLKTGFGSLDGEEDGEDIGIGLESMKLAVRILWGDAESDDNLDEPEAYEDGDIPNSIRVAIASDVGMTLSGHFGSCLRFLIYQVSATDSRLIGIRPAIEADYAEDKNAFRAQIIGDCHVVYVVSVGGPAAAKIIRANIYPIKRPEGGSTNEIIVQFQKAMRDSPPPWLLKILGVDAGQRLKNYAGSEVD